MPISPVFVTLAPPDHVYGIAVLPKKATPKSDSGTPNFEQAMQELEALVERMEKTPKAAQPEEGIRICCEIIEQVRTIPGVAGLDIPAAYDTGGSEQEIEPERVAGTGSLSEIIPVETEEDEEENKKILKFSGGRGVSQEADLGRR